ncbi:Thioredoxin-like domain-containing protein [Myroides profundi]|uniref:Thioredoxin-like domain-containing protein n=2 Tax=Myroides profundi TaxID=480520 RepID=A0AAJ4W0P7_MYRPR|nr:Thioredoxin-like domain-containing protein [Myroides profundi]
MMLIALFFSVGIMAQDKLHITGKITGIPKEAKLMLSYDKKEIELKAIDGVFVVEAEIVKAPTPVYLSIMKGDDYEYTSFFLGNETVTIDGRFDDLKSLQAKGSRYDTLRYESEILTRELRTERQTIESKVSKEVDSGMSYDNAMAPYKVEYLRIEQKIKDLDYEFLKKNINTDYGRYLVGFIMHDTNTNHYKELYDLVDSQYQNTDPIVFLKALIDNKVLVKGGSYYDFTALDMNEKEVTFSDYFKGKYVLLDFSSPYCYFCQQAVPITSKLAKALEDKLVYVTYCIENDLHSVEKYRGLKGDHGVIVWDKRGMQSPTIAKYRMSGTPYYALFNLEGRLLKIFDKGLEEDFEEQLRALMK